MAKLKTWATYDDKMNTELYLLPVNPLTHHSSVYEVDDLVAVVQTFAAGKIPEINPNPYKREFARRGKMESFIDSEWDALVSPSDYRLPLGARLRFRDVIIAMIALMILIGAVVLAVYMNGP